MAGRHSVVNPAANDDNAQKTNMMDLWKESIQRSQQKQKKAAELAQSHNETRTDLEQRVRNGQEPCSTCANRVYQDESNDGGVSFQSARHLSAATAGVTVMGHEHEHVAAGKAKSAEDGVIRDSKVSLEYGKCPECGKTYVKGGVTKTTTRPGSYRANIRGLDAQA